MDPNAQTNQQNLKCGNCGMVTLADGSQVWVCQHCQTENVPEPVAQPAPVQQPAGIDMAPVDMTNVVEPAPVNPAQVTPAAPITP